ncbi:MAG TPA: hypothetical protein VM490_12065 [Armatimonadaceae bacterium]|nr:hypothetical protein [Armatimonadaceae bacterium]
MHKQMKPSGQSAAGRGFLLVFGALWTGVSLLFAVFALIGSRGSGGAGIFGFLFSLLFVAIGCVLLAAGLLPTLRALKVTPPQVSVSSDLLRLGESFQFSYRQEFKSSLVVETARAEFVKRESASYTRGTDRYTDTHEEILGSVSAPGRTYNPGEVLEFSQTFTVPPDTMHTFQASNNKIEYFVKVNVAIAKWPDVKDDYAVVVVPERAASASPVAGGLSA